MWRSRTNSAIGSVSRILLISAIPLILIAVALFGNLSGQISQVRTLLIGSLVSATGLSVQINGSVELSSVLPLTFTADNLSFGDGRQRITVKKLFVFPQLMQALVGKPTANRIELEGVTLSVRRRPNGQIFIRGMPMFSRRLPDLLNGRSGAAGIREVTLRDLKVEFEDRAGDLDGSYNAELLRASWDGNSAAVSIETELTNAQDGTQIKLAAVKENADSWVDTAVVGEVTAPNVTIKFDGQATPGKISTFSGEIDASGPNLIANMAFFGLTDLASDLVLPWQASGQVEIVGMKADLSDAQIALDRQAASGAIKVILGGRPAISGTIDLETLDLTDYLPGIAGKDPTQSKGAAERLDFLSSIDMDLRLSSRQTAMGPLQLGETAATVYSKNGNLSLSVAETDLAGGRLQANLAAEPDGDALDAAFTVRLRNASAVELANQFSFPVIFDSTVSLQLTGKLDNILADQPLPLLSGSGSISANNGRWFGVQMGLDDGQVSDIIADESSEAQVQSLSGNYDIIDGIILPQNFQAEIDGGTININGEIAMDTGLSALMLSSGARQWAIRGILSNPQITTQ